ncbi:MerR family transcriptional regulator [Nocardia sp. NPDC051321]|uniref:MerR family transcriptional regulator n=1 Tax=Nocardia sp. NPDC051321 TaxID=3364323 RepID=UPI00378CFF7F
MRPSQQGYLRIGAVAERTALSIKTIRHYDEVGLITPSARSTGGFRLYTTADVDRLLVIRRMKPLGFTLAEMRRLLTAVEVLDALDSAAEERADAGAYVRQCRERAEGSCVRLRRQLAYAEEFTQLLARTQPPTLPDMSYS